jgi:hypothetical protein
VVTAARDMDQVKYGSDILHIVYPLLDGKNEDITSFFDNFFQLIENNISQGSVLVHCAAGISRVLLSDLELDSCHLLHHETPKFNFQTGHRPCPVAPSLSASQPRIREAAQTLRRDSPREPHSKERDI